MKPYLRYVNPRLNHAEHDRYYGESVRACRYYGANCTPASILLCNWIVDSEGEDTTSGLRFTCNRQLHLPQRFAKLWSGPEANHPVTSNHLVRFRSTSTRKNLPPG